MEIINISSLFVRRIHGVASLAANFSKQFNHDDTEIFLGPWAVCMRVCVCVASVSFPVRGLEELVGG